ncbi:methyltransferase domain-containing protein [Streptomyces sp. MUM 203J]|uniref:class I SAM-dependent methyltransferase n=1 Tax=Streptomyces sp. MUM 203J TaxID=2791990 RepID=UPI001F03B1FC|nr:class I SAM-dependent methyltransferase [Streptomyces sp. MUM 203J]MCH0542317.1 methyltransferase domain-containing protein [Streptomyces sp. MUM 203J]
MTQTAAPRTHSTGSLNQGKVSPLDQVQLFEKKYDPGTRKIIEGLPLERPWRCLEIGAGGGSMSGWLARKADLGTVLAVDIDTSHLRAVHADPVPNLTLRQADLSEADFTPGSFDLVLARAVFEHLPQPAAVLERAVNWLAPGGWLVVEDFYYLPPEDAPSTVGRTLLEGYLNRMRAQGADLWWGRRLPATLASAGLTSVSSRITPAGPGQSAVDDELIGLRLGQEGHVLVENGVVTADRLAEFVGSLGDPRKQDMTTLLVSAWGRRPPA